MRIHFNKLLIAGVLGYLCYEFYNLYLFCQPPVAEVPEQGVKWDLLDKPPLDICVYLALSDHYPPESFVKERRLDSGKHIKTDGRDYFLLGIFDSVSPRTGEAPRDKLLLESVKLPSAFYKNGTVFLHVVAVPHSEGYLPVRHQAVRISRHQVQPERRIRKEYLLGAPPPGHTGPTDVEKVEAAIGAKPVTSLPRVIEVGFVIEDRALDIEGLRSKGLEGNVIDRKLLRLPLFVNTMVSPRDEYAPLFKGTRLPSLELRLRNVGMGLWSLQDQLKMAFDEAERLYGIDEYDSDSFKQMVSGSTPLKALLVYMISILHLIFEYLAFSSDISFWRKKTSFEGLSSSSVALQACMNIIMFLYVREQKQTRFVMYLIGGRFFLQLWKLRKLTKLEFCRSFPFVRWVNRAGAEGGLEELQEIQDAERRCMRILILALLPAVFAFTGYRLVFYKFRSWYSWVVLSLAVCAQMGGFVVMTPQVFMNYRLKSVEHLPWRALTYQAINTFIDDIFTLCIRMPEIQKYSVFRDDIIFIICCMQRYLYRKPAKDVAPVEEKAKDAGAEGKAQKSKDD